MLYLDQPIGVGFSYGDEVVNSTWAAAPYVWEALQILFKSDLFSQYQTSISNKFIFASESYGGMN